MNIPPCCRAAISSPTMRRMHRRDAYAAYPLLEGRKLELYVECQMQLDLAQHLRVDHGARGHDVIDGRTITEIEGRIVERMNAIIASTRLRKPEPTHSMAAAA